MSAAHTQGKLAFREDGDANAYHLTIDGRWLLALLHNGEPLVEVQRENMRRLVACWNRLSTWSTAEILNGVIAVTPMDEYANGVKRHNELVRHNADLLEAAQLLIASRSPHMCHRNAKERKAYELFRAAIAKATGAPT